MEHPSPDQAGIPDKATWHLFRGADTTPGETFTQRRENLRDCLESGVPESIDSAAVGRLESYLVPTRC